MMTALLMTDKSDDLLRRMTAELMTDKSDDPAGWGVREQLNLKLFLQF